MKKFIIFLILLPLFLIGCLNQAEIKTEKAGPPQINANLNQAVSPQANLNVNQEKINSNVGQNKEIPQKKNIEVSLILKFDSQEEKYDETIEAGQTVFYLLTLVAAKNGFSVKFKNYPEMGVFITEINGQENGQGNKYWQYTVNDYYAEKAADKLELKEGDIVTWEFKESSF